MSSSNLPAIVTPRTPGDLLRAALAVLAEERNPAQEIFDVLMIKAWLGNGLGEPGYDYRMEVLAFQLLVREGVLEAGDELRQSGGRRGMGVAQAPVVRFTEQGAAWLADPATAVTAAEVAAAEAAAAEVAKRAAAEAKAKKEAAAAKAKAAKAAAEKAAKAKAAAAKPAAKPTPKKPTPKKPTPRKSRAKAPAKEAGE